MCNNENKRMYSVTEESGYRFPGVRQPVPLSTNRVGKR